LNPGIVYSYVDTSKIILYLLFKLQQIIFDRETERDRGGGGERERERERER
jgi:hypothetical protein